MTGANALRPDDWDEVVAKRLPLLEIGQRNARGSWEHIVSIVTLQIQSAQSSVNEHELRLLAAVAAADYELKTLLLRLVQASEDRAIWHKYVALLLWQSINELPKRLGAGLKDQGAAFRDAVKDVRGDQAFMSELDRIRNGVAAHLDLGAAAPGSVEWSYDSINAELVGAPAIQTELVIKALIVSGAVHELGSSLLRKHSRLFPGART